MISLYGKTAIEAAIESGRLIKRSVGKVGRISYKGRDNIVTDVDKRSEKCIIDKVSAHYPGHSILSEEAGLIVSSSKYKWILDPLDGTTNFSRGFPFFCVSIALEKEQDIILGVVYDPMRDELFYAEKRRGAYLNNKRIRVSTTKKLEDAFLATGFSYGSSKDNNIRNFKDFLLKSMAIRRAGSAALDLCYVACGRFDGFWEIGLQQWDSAAGSIIIKEAGGSITGFDGGQYDQYKNEVLASNRYIHSRMISVLSR